jgi:hypothetical protein
MRPERTLLQIGIYRKARHRGYGPLSIHYSEKDYVPVETDYDT